MDFWAVFLAAPLYQLLNAVVAPLVTQGAQGVLELVGTSSNITSPSGGHREMDMEMAPLSQRSVVVTYIGHSWKLLLGYVGRVLEQWVQLREGVSNGGQIRPLRGWFSRCSAQTIASALIVSTLN